MELRLFRLLCVSDRERWWWWWWGGCSQSLTEQAARISGTHTHKYAIQGQTDWQTICSRQISVSKKRNRSHTKRTDMQTCMNTNAWSHAETQSTDQGRPISSASVMRRTPDAGRQSDRGFERVEWKRMTSQYVEREELRSWT